MMVFSSICLDEYSPLTVGAGPGLGGERGGQYACAEEAGQRGGRGEQEAGDGGQEGQ